KVEIATSITLASPNEASSAYLISSMPFKWFDLFIRVILIDDKILLGSFVVTGRPNLDWAEPPVFQGDTSTMRQVPRVFHVIIINNMPYITSPFQDECFEPLFTELLCSPSTADSCADYDCVVLIAFSHNNVNSLGKRVD